jgi:NADPH:quinone reductase-like Zn-dependent oxidoreductase
VLTQSTPESGGSDFKLFLHGDHRPLDLLPFRKNLSFFAIDMDRLALDNPELTADIARAVGEAMLVRHYKRVPVMRFPMGKVKEAMELMKSGRHTGKVCGAVLKPLS